MTSRAGPLHIAVAGLTSNALAWSHTPQNMKLNPIQDFGGRVLYRLFLADPASLHREVEALRDRVDARARSGRNV